MLYTTTFNNSGTHHHNLSEQYRKMQEKHPYLLRWNWKYHGNFGPY